MRTSECGFTYLLLLFVLAVSGAALVSLGEHLAVDVQRQREAELLFRGQQIAHAIERFRARRVDGQQRWPRSLEELVVDRRAAEPVHHLRRLYPDPFSGRADWLPVVDGEGGVVGVRSRATLVGFARVQVPEITPDADGLRRVALTRWRFIAREPEGDAEPEAAEAAEAAASTPR